MENDTIFVSMHGRDHLGNRKIVQEGMSPRRWIAIHRNGFSKTKEERQIYKDLGSDFLIFAGQSNFDR